MLLLVAASPAYAVPPPPLNFDTPDSDIVVPWGTVLTLTGDNKQAGSHVFIDGESNTTACEPDIPDADYGAWVCTRTEPHITGSDTDISVTQSNEDGMSDPNTHAIGVEAPLFAFTSSPNTPAGQPIVVGGVVDAALPGVTVNANLQRVSDTLLMESVPCDVAPSASTFTCTFAGVPVSPDGYRATGTETSITYPAVPAVEALSSDFLVTPPVVDPPVIDPPVIDPPVIDPPVIDPPVIDPPVIDPPVVNPPVVNPPSIDPPAIDPPAIDPPSVDPPIFGPPIFDPPSADPPSADPPSADPPSADPPSADGPDSSKTEKPDDLKRLLELGILAMTVLTMGGALGATRVAGRLAGANNTADVGAIMNDRDDDELERDITLEDRVGPGDRSITWRFPWHGPIDAKSLLLPAAVSPRTPFVGRLLADGSQIRAMLGSLWLLVLTVGAALGVAAAVDTSGRAVPPALWLVIAIIVISILDALAGALAVVTFTGSVLVTGHFWGKDLPDGKHALLVILTLGFVWVALPLIGSAIRPFRRLGKPGAAYAWDRFADVLIAALLCAWVAQKIIGAMDLFAGVEAPIIEHADAVALVVMGAVVARVGVEQLALVWYPARLRAVDVPGTLPEGTHVADVAGAAIRVLVFAFIGYVFIGTCWQWWVGVALFAVPEVVGLLQQPFGRLESLRNLVPKGIVEIFVLVVACTLAARYAVDHAKGDLATLKMAFIVLAVPPAALGLLRLFTDDEKRSGRSWGREFVGLGVLVATVWLVLQGWDF